MAQSVRWWRPPGVAVPGAGGGQELLITPPCPVPASAGEFFVYPCEILPPSHSSQKKKKTKKRGNFSPLPPFPGKARTVLLSEDGKSRPSRGIPLLWLGSLPSFGEFLSALGFFVGVLRGFPCVLVASSRILGASSKILRGSSTLWVFFFL